MATNGGGHDADGAGAGDQHVLADEIIGEGRVNGVAEGIENGADFIINFGGQVNGVEGGELEVFGEGAGNIDAHALARAASAPA